MHIVYALLKIQNPHLRSDGGLVKFDYDTYHFNSKLTWNKHLFQCVRFFHILFVVRDDACIHNYTSLEVHSMRIKQV